MKRETLEEKTSEELVELLKEDASLASKFDEYSLWSKIITWSYLLAEQPRFADKCDKWGEFDADDWLLLLYYQPQFADKCDKWDEFDADVWYDLLAEHPQFADKCDKLCRTEKERNIFF